LARLPLAEWTRLGMHPCRLVVIGCMAVLFSGCSITPHPLLEEDIGTIANFDRELIFQQQEEIEGELTLELAIAMALKYNLENRVRMLEELVANQQLRMTETEMLPNLAARAGYSDRDNINASRSISISTGQESLEPSTSQEQAQSNASATYTWNLLDFGASYLRAKQDADRYLIAQKAREKVMLSLVNEVRNAYWQAVAMEQMRDELDHISAKVDEQVGYWEAVREERLRPPISVLMDIRALIETQQQLDEVRRSIDTASARLANLINARDFRQINFPKNPDFPTLSALTTDIEALELIALRNSTDYASEIYKVRIDQLESRRAMIQLLPGLEFSYGENYNDNEFLLNKRWGQFGFNLTGDLTRLMFAQRIRKFRETNEQLTITRKLAINMAVITSVHIAWQDYQNAWDRLERADHLKEIDGLISILTDNAQANQAESGATSIQTALKAFRSNIKQAQAYADLQRAFGAFVASIGINPVPENYQAIPAPKLADDIAQALEQEIFPYTAEGQRMLAEKRKLDEWATESAVLAGAEPVETIRLSSASPRLSDLLASFQQGFQTPQRLTSETTEFSSATR